MRFIDIFNNEKCTEIYQSVNIFSNTLLKPYNDQIESQEFIPSSKDIFDFVWGTVELNAVEICLIDSPILQRLRNIHQMGFAGYVYCNADYSRFAHTIGVVEASGRIAKVITNKLKHKSFTLNNKNFDMEEVVRLGAILHDTGHLFFSHVSEDFFTNNEFFSERNKITMALSFFNEHISARASLHEMLSVMIVNSDEARRFFKIASKYAERSKLNCDEHYDTLIDYISGLIVGIAIDKNILPYSTIIKGSIDADRLDYLSRDSATTKVPLAVDIARLIKKLTVVVLNEYQPSRLWRDIASDTQHISMAIQYSAQRLIWQLSMARTILYQSIYFHHKKLTAEAMFIKACEKIFSLLPTEKRNFTYIMSLTDQAMGEYFQDVVIPQKFHIEEQFYEAKEIIDRIKNRNLYKRVASFSQDAFYGEGYKYEIFIANVIENQFSEKHKVFVEDLTNEYFLILDKLRIERPKKKPVFMFIEANWQNESLAAIPIDFGNEPYKFSSDVFKDTPVIGEENKQRKYYLVTDQIKRILVYIALEKALFRQLDIRIKDGASTCAKFTLEKLEKTRKDLFEKDYYNDCFLLLSNKLFSSLYNNNIFLEIVNKYRSFSGVNNSKVTNDTLFSYLKQFLYLNCDRNELVSLLDGILFLLQKATFIDREYFTQNTTSLMKKIKLKGYKNNYIVKLGNSFDSAGRLTYYFNDVKETINFNESVPEALKQAARDSESSILFFDDGAYSGKQAVSIFQELMGVPKEYRATYEEHSKELVPEDKEKLKKSNIILGFICFNSQSEKYILEELKKLGICNVCIVYEHDLLNKKAFDLQTGIFNSEEQLLIVKKYMNNIGYEVLKSAKTKDGRFNENWSEERISNSALGYNDAQQVVVFDFNIPTYSLTALWQNGAYKGHKWKGLFQRTDKN
jgi:deoxynucleoside triphosphate triphosphohydrolase SAMHD1